MAQAFGTDHHELVLKPDVVGIVEDLSWYLDEPFGDTSAIPTYMVSKLAATQLKVPKSTVSRGLSQLEAELGVELVVRTSRRFRRSSRSKMRPSRSLPTRLGHPQLCAMSKNRGGSRRGSLRTSVR